jgi:hypothetical protein
MFIVVRNKKKMGRVAVIVATIKKFIYIVQMFLVSTQIQVVFVMFKSTGLASRQNLTAFSHTGANMEFAKCGRMLTALVITVQIREKSVTSALIWQGLSTTERLTNDR